MTLRFKGPGLAAGLLAGATMLAPAIALSAPAPADWVPSTSQSPPTSLRVTDRTSMDGTWETWNGRKDPANSPQPPIPPAPLKPQYQAEVDAHAKAVREANAAHEPLSTPAVACLPDGFPAMMRAAFPLEILMTPGQVTMINEAFNEVRRIYLDEPQGKIGDVEPVWFGHSVGHWEGKTLVVDTIGVKEEVKFRDTPHSDQMRVDERITMTGPDFIRDEMTITDPVTLTKPWAFTWVLHRDPGYKMQEYVCEANREYTDANGIQHLRVDKK